MKLNCLFLIPLLVLIGVSSAANQWLSATLLDYDTVKFYAAYSGDEPTTTGLTILDGSQNELVPQTQITDADTNPDGYFVCYPQHKVCEVFAKKILDLRASSASIVISLLTSDMQASEAVTAEYVGRNLEWPSGVSSSAALTSFDQMQPTFGGLEPSLIGWDSVPSSLQIFTDAGAVIGVIVTFSSQDGTSPSQTFGNTQSGQSSSLQLTRVETINLYADGNGAVCGINIVDDGTANSFGCNTNEASYPIQSSFAFAGFSGLQQLAVDGSFVLYPLQYQLLHPRVMEWETTDEEITFTFNIFWPAETLTYFQTTRKTARNANNQVDVETQELGSGIVDNPTPYTGFYAVKVASLPCSPVGLVINTVQTANRVFEDQAAFYAWTYGYQVDSEIVDSGVAVDSPSSNAPVFSSRPKYTASVASDQTCDVILPVKFNLVGSQLIVNDHSLGDNTESASDADLNMEGKFINKVTVHINSGILVGLTLAYGDITLATVGQSSGTSSEQVTPNKDNLVLLYIEAFYENGKTTGLKFYWAQPREPVLIKGVNVQSSVTGPVNSAQFTSGLDADVQEIVWYSPVDYSKIKLYLSSTSTGAELDNQISILDSTQTRGRDGRGVVRSLVASSTYSLYLEGIVEFQPQVNGGEHSITSIQSEDKTFITPPGADVSCGGTPGAMDIHVEYEAIPSLSTNFNSQSQSVLTPSDTTGLDSKSSFSEIQSSIWPVDTVFQRDPPDSADEFTGYPVGIQVYWTQSDSCIRGLAFTYKIYGDLQTSVWVAGSEAGYTAAPDDTKAEQSFSDVTESVFYQLAGNCLSGIQFTSSGNGGSCIGPAATCTQTASTGNSNQFFYSVTAQSSIDGIFGLTFDFASIALPTLSAIEKSCTLVTSIDFFWLRSTYWSLNLDLATDVGQCGTFQQLLESQTPTQTFISQNAVYQQNIARTQEDALTGSSDPFALKSWSIPAYCFYNSQGDATGKAANVQQIVYAVSKSGEIPFKMQIYTNYKYNTPYQEESPKIVVGDNIYVMISAQSELTSFEVVSTDCWATRTNNALDGDRYILQSDTCPVDSSFERDLVDTPMSFAFHFTAFAWLINGRMSDTGIYLHCDVRACPQGEAYCAIKDPSECEGGQRKRRSIDHEVAPFGSKQYRLHLEKPIIITNGKENEPQILQVMREEVTLIQIQQNSPGAVEDLLKLTTFLLAVLLIWFYFKKYHFGKRQKSVRKF